MTPHLLLVDPAMRSSPLISLFVRRARRRALSALGALTAIVLTLTVSGCASDGPVDPPVGRELQGRLTLPATGAPRVAALLTFAPAGAVDSIVFSSHLIGGDAPASSVQQSALRNDRVLLYAPDGLGPQLRFRVVLAPRIAPTTVSGRVTATSTVDGSADQGADARVELLP